MEMSDGNDINTNTSTDDKYSTLGANNSETETRISLCEKPQDFGSHNNSISTASEANIEILKVAHTVLFQKSEEISTLGDITDANVDRGSLEIAVKDTAIGGVKVDKLEGFEESIKEIKTSECGGGDASVNCLGYTEPKDPAVCTIEVTDSTKNISEKIYYSLAEVNTDGKEDNAELVKTDDHRGKRNKESGICMRTVEDIVVDTPENTEQLSTAINSAHDSALQCIETDKKENTEVDLSENTEQQVNTAVDSAHDSSLQDTETDKEENIEVDSSENTEQQANTAVDSACESVLQFTETDKEENIEVDPSENTEQQANTAVDSACESVLQFIETDKEENIEVDSSENSEQLANTAVNSACDSVLQLIETDKEENIEVDLPRNTELVSTVIDSACRILECTEAGAHIGNTNEGVGIDREESTPRVQTVQDVNTDERGTDKPKESINKDTTEVTKFLIEGNNLVTILTNRAVTENEGTITKRPETKVTETQTNCPQTDKTESEVEIISPNTFNSDIKKSGAEEGEIIKCFLEERTNFSSPDHIPKIFITSAEPISADLPSTLETQKTKVETDTTDSQEDDSMDVDLTQNETTLTKDVEKPLETTKYFGYNQGNPDNLSSYNDAQEPMEIAEHSILNYDDKDFDTDSDFEAEAHLSGGESKKLEAAEKEPEPEAAEKEPELEVEETPEKKMGCTKSKAKRTQFTVNQHGQSSDEENDENGWQIQQSKKSKTSTFRNDFWSTRDTNTYRERYPGKEDNPDLNANLKFYKGRITSCPKGDYIDEIHRKWWGNYDKLEQHHGYIQWLFPIREQGMNWHAQELQPHEAKAIMADSEAMERFLKSYKMMLHFYGMELVSEKTGEVKRAKNCQERFRHLNHSMHNYLRITRILKCLGELGREHYKAPFICFVLKEAIVHKTLDRTLDSCFKYWIGTLRNEEERADIDKYIDELYNDRFQEEENRKSGVENFKMVEIKEGVGEEESKGKNKQEKNRKRQKENSMKKEEEEGKKSQEEENREDEETRKRQEEENRNKEKENERVDDETGKRKEEENRKRDVKNESLLDDTRKKKKDENRKGEEENERVNNETRMRQEEENTKREEKNENVLGDTRKEEENTKREEENESVLDDTRKKEEENKKREEENDETRMSQDEENNKSDKENVSVLDDTRKKEEENRKREEENDETRMSQDEENMM